MNEAVKEWDGRPAVQGDLAGTFFDATMEAGLAGTFFDATMQGGLAGTSFDATMQAGLAGPSLTRPLPPVNIRKEVNSLLGPSSRGSSRGREEVAE